MPLPDVGPPPGPRFDVTPTEDEIAHFREYGFMSIERITTDEEIDWLVPIYEYLIETMFSIDRSGIEGNPDQRGLVHQYFNPETPYPQLLETNYVRNAKKYAAAILKEAADDLTMWGHMIRKLPNGRAVPPHQDIAFWPPDYDFRTVNVWLPLHDCSVEQGTMQFRPHSHLGECLPHRHYDHPSQNLITVTDPDALEPPVACPLKKGGATFHDPSTVHQTNVNTTDTPRLAFPITVQTVPTRRTTRRDTPWLDEFHEATGQIQTTYTADGVEVPLPEWV